MISLFDEFCKRHGVRYWLSGGSLMGAVRDQEPTAWDMEGDVTVVGTDSELARVRRLLQEVNQFPGRFDRNYSAGSTPRYWYQDTENDACYTSNQVAKIRSTAMVYGEFVLWHNGLQWDIFYIAPEGNTFKAPAPVG